MMRCPANAPGAAAAAGLTGVSAARDTALSAASFSLPASISSAQGTRPVFTALEIMSGICLRASSNDLKLPHLSGLA